MELKVKHSARIRVLLLRGKTEEFWKRAGGWKEGRRERAGNDICCMPYSFCKCIVVVGCHTGRSFNEAMVNLLNYCIILQQKGK